MKRVLSTAAIALMLLLNPISTPRTNATTRCGQAPPQGRVVVRVGFRSAGETTRLLQLRRNIQSHTKNRVEICDFIAGALPPIPIIQVGGDYSREEAIELVNLIREKVPGTRVYMSSSTAELDWTERRIPEPH